MANGEVECPTIVEDLTDGGQIVLNDGSVWRVGTKYLAIAKRWKIGDHVELIKNPGFVFQNSLLNSSTGDMVPVTASSKL